MLQQIKISTEQDPNFLLCWDLYISAFPIEERRDREYQIETLRANAYNFEAIFDDDKFVGIIGWWQFESCRYIEHFATSPLLRGGGYGKEILREFAAKANDTIVLEVEHPTEEMSKRRIGFYEHEGYVLNEFDYSHPPYHLDQEEFVSLIIMSYPCAITHQEFEEFKKECYKRVHFRHTNV